METHIYKDYMKLKTKLFKSLGKHSDDKGQLSQLALKLKTMFPLHVPMKQSGLTDRG